MPDIATQQYLAQIAILCAASGLAAASPAFAGGAESCHFHGSKPAAQNTLADCAVLRQQALIASGKLDKAWQGIKP